MSVKCEKYKLLGERGMSGSILTAQVTFKASDNVDIEGILKVDYS
jgi:hypothetical protein